MQHSLRTLDSCTCVCIEIHVYVGRNSWKDYFGAFINFWESTLISLAMLRVLETFSRKKIITRSHRSQLRRNERLYKIRRTKEKAWESIWMDPPPFLTICASFAYQLIDHNYYRIYGTVYVPVTIILAATHSFCFFRSLNIADEKLLALLRLSSTACVQFI